MWWCRSWAAEVGESEAALLGLVHTVSPWPSALITNQISQAKDGIDEDLSPSALSRVSSSNLATISFSSLACEASAKLNFLSHPLILRIGYSTFDILNLVL